MLSCRARYGLKAVLRLAADPERKPLLAADIARLDQLPHKFLEQILLELKHRGLLHSKRGRGGGYCLARPADQMYVGEVVRALDGALAPVTCVSQLAYRKCCEGCVDETICGVHLVMKEVRDAMAGVLDTTTVADVIRSMGGDLRRPATPQLVVRRSERPTGRPPAPLPYPGPRRKARG